MVPKARKKKKTNLKGQSIEVLNAQLQEHAYNEYVVMKNKEEFNMKHQYYHSKYNIPANSADFVLPL